MNTKRYNLNFQVLRGIAILFVVFIHLQSGTGYSYDSFSYNFWLLCRQIANIAVPIFFCMSGYFVNAKDYENGWIDYWKNIGGMRLVVPYLLWSLIYTALNILVNPDMFSAIFTLKQFVKIFIGKAAPQLYFVFVLIQLKALTPVYLKYRRNGRSMLILIIISSVVWIGLYNANKILNLGIPDYFSVCFLSWQLYYFWGIELEEKISIEQGWLSIWVVVLGLLSLGESFVLKEFDFPEAYQVSQLRPVNMIFALFACILLVNWAKKQKYEGNRVYMLFSKIGDFSYPIYYIHFIPVIFCNCFLFKLIDVYSFPLPVVQLAEGAFVIGITIVTDIILSKVLGKKKYLMGL